MRINQINASGAYSLLLLIMALLARLRNFPAKGVFPATMKVSPSNFLPYMALNQEHVYHNPY